MNSNDRKDKKRRIYMWSIILHMFLVTAIAIPIFQANQQDELLVEGILVQFSNTQNESLSRKKATQKTRNNPSKKAAKAKAQKPKSAQSTGQPPVSKNVKNPATELKANKLKAVKSETPVTDQIKNTEAEERREFIQKQMDARAEKERIHNLVQKARMEKFEKMKNAFSQILENATDETIDNSNFDLSGEGLLEPDLADGSNDATGIDEHLGDRKVLFVPEIKDPTQKQGRVVINICVNAAGNVISARYTQKGSTTTDSYLIKLAEKNALRYKFSESKASKQCGIVNIDFIVT